MGSATFPSLSLTVWQYHAFFCQIWQHYTFWVYNRDMKKTTAIIVSSLVALLVFVLVALGGPAILGLLFAVFLINNPDSISAEAVANVGGAIQIVCVLGGLILMGYVGKKIKNKILGKQV
jgi:hypothetical protein